MMQMMHEPIIRPGTEADLDAMLALWRALEQIQGAHRLFPMVDDPETRITALFREAIANPDSAALVIEGPEGLLGMAIVRLSEQGHHSMSNARVVELSRVVVKEEARGQGLGTKLIGAATAFAHARGATFLTAKLFTGNAAGRAFWERLGFVPRYEERIKPV
jgi:GNAT superfamily N-acetyltransferase